MQMSAEIKAAWIEFIREVEILSKRPYVVSDDALFNSEYNRIQRMLYRAYHPEVYCEVCSSEPKKKRCDDCILKIYDQELSIRKSTDPVNILYYTIECVSVAGVTVLELERILRTVAL